MPTQEILLQLQHPLQRRDSSPTRIEMTRNSSAWSVATRGGSSVNSRGEQRRLDDVLCVSALWSYDHARLGTSGG